MLWYQFVWVLALFGLTNAAAGRHGSARRPGSRHLSNSERVRRGLPLNRPKEMYDPSRTHVFAARASGAAGDPANIVMQPVTFSRKRALEAYYLYVENGVPKTTIDPSKASQFIIPNGLDGKDLLWLPSIAEAAAQGVTAGAPLRLFADVVGGVGSGGIYTLKFAAGTATGGLSSFFSVPPFSKGFSPILDSGSTHPHTFLWAMAPDGTISFVQDAATMRAASLNAQVMVAQAVAPGAMPTTADALAYLQQQLIMPAKLYVLGANNSVAGYVNVSPDDSSLVVAGDGATFFAPGLTTGQMSHIMTTLVNGVANKIFQSDSSIAGTSNATSLGVTPEATTDTARFILPTTGQGVVKVFGHGIGNWQMYVANNKVYTCSAAADCYAKYKAQPVCAELVTPGIAPSACAALFANGVPTDLLPVVPPGTNTGDIGNLDPKNTGNSTYTENGITDATIQHLFAVVEANYTYPTVILPEISAVSDVDCAQNGLLIKFNNTRAYTYAVNQWTPYNNGTGFILVTNTLACSTADVGQRGYWLVNSLEFRNATREIYVDADEIGVSDAFNNIHVIWGTYVPVEAKPTPDVQYNSTVLLGPETANSTVNMYTQYSNLACLNPPASYLGLPTAPCGPNFDQVLDAKLGFISIDDVNAMNDFSPSLGDQIAVAKQVAQALGEPLNRRDGMHYYGKRGWFSNAWNKVREAANRAAEIAASIRRAAEAVAARVAAEARALAERVAAEARRVAAEAAAAAARAAAALKAAAEAAMRLKVNLKTPTANLPIAVVPGGYFAKAFGTDKSLVIWETSFEKEFGPEGKEGATTKTESKFTAEIGLYCVDCGVTGNARLQGELEYRLLPPILTVVGINMNADLVAQVNLGVIAEAAYTYSIEKQLWSQPIPGAGIKIGNFLTVGVAVTVAAKAEFALKAEGEVVAGIGAHWNNIDIHVNLLNPFDNYAKNLAPRFEPKFEARGQAGATLGLGLPITLGVGVIIPPLQFNKLIGVVNTPGVEAEIKYTSSGGDEADEDQCGAPGGLGWAITVSDKFSLDIVGKEIELGTVAEYELAGGCIRANGSPEPPETAITVPVKSLPPPPPPPVYPTSTCPGYTSTGRVPWAVYEDIDIDGDAFRVIQGFNGNRYACDDLCRQYDQCVFTTWEPNSRICVLVQGEKSRYKPRNFQLTIRGESCESNLQYIPGNLRQLASRCCTAYRY